MRGVSAILVLATAAVAADTFPIAGTVIDGRTGAPAAHIRVGLVRDGQNSRESFTVTATDGRFRFAGLPKGVYTVTADHPSGVRQRYGQPEAGPAIGVAVVTGPEQRTENIVFRLYPPAGIHGRVVDQAGDAVEGVLIQIFRTVVSRGRRITVFWGSVRTNDIGEYRFGPLQAGSYDLLATGRPWYVERLGPGFHEDGLAEITYLPTFYPNSRDPGSAAPVRLRAGEDFAANLILTALPAGRLTVNVGEGSAAALKRSARFDIIFEGPGGAICWERTDWIFGTKEYGGIPQGRYTVRVLTTETEPLYGQDTVVIAGMAPVKIDVPLAKMPVVSGTLKLENGVPVPPGTVVELENEMENRHFRRAVDTKGEFRFEDVPPGRYMPLLASLDTRLRLNGVWIDGKPARDEIDVRQSTQLDLTGAAAGAEIAGYVFRNGEPQPGLLTLLIPKRDSLTPYDYLLYQTDSDGSFRFRPLAPGVYRLVAIEDWVELEYAKPEALQPYLAGAREIEVKEIARQEIRIDLK